MFGNEVGIVFFKTMKIFLGTNNDDFEGHDKKCQLTGDVSWWC